MVGSRIFSGLKVCSIGALVLLFAQLAVADRYMVVIKNKDLFSQVRTQLGTGESKLGQLGIQTKASSKPGTQAFVSAAEVRVSDSFQNLQTIVIEAESEAQAMSLAQLPGVGLVEKEIFHPKPRPVGGFHLTKPWDYSLRVGTELRPQNFRLEAGPKTPWGILAVRAPQAWALGTKGQASRVMVLDTGIDKDHPALKDNFEKGRDFTGETSGSPYPFADTEGHGTHCSGTIAAVQAADGFEGVAPQAKLLMGRVCGEAGCSSIAVAAGMNWAISEKVDVLSMSLGGPVATGVEKRAVAAAEAAGIAVVAASGNDGTPAVGYPAAFSTVIAVGAIDSSLVKAKFSQWGPELAVVAPGVAVISSVPQGSGRESEVLVNSEAVKSAAFGGSPEIPRPLKNSLVYAGLGKPGEYPAAVRGKFALVSRGEITFAEKLKNALAAGAAGILIYNNEPGLMQGALNQDGTTAAIPVVMIELVVGQQIKASLQQGTPVEASLQTKSTDYASFAGTSMATPHVAGLVALMRTANKSLTPAMIKNILKSTATPMGPNSENEMGSGLVNAEKAVEAALAAPR